MSEFMTSDGRKVQQVEGTINTSAPVGGATEAKQDSQITLLGDVVEAAPGTDTASSGINGRLQRIAQRISSLITAVGSPFQAGGSIGNTAFGVNNAAGASAVNIQDGGNSITVDGTIAVSNASIPVTDNAGSITVDAPVATPVFVRLSDGAAAITTLPVSLASVPSHAVTNAGTFAVQSTNQANSGVDIGDVTINNAAGASAVNIQDGGNTITVDGTVSVTGSTVQDIPAVSGGLSKFHLVGAATTNQTNVKASAGQVYAITAFNTTATPVYLKFHNTAGSPTAGSGVTDTFLIPGNTNGSGMVINIDKGIAFSTGIAITVVAGIADADATAIGASSVVLNIYYK